MCTRRGFVVGCSAAIAHLASARFTSVLFAGQPADPADTLVVLYLRGGADGLSIVFPTDGPDRAFYETARPALKVAPSGLNGALDLGSLGAWGGNQFGLHPGCGPLHELWQDGRVAFVHAAGMPTGSRSHFDTQFQMELGTPGISSTTSGWLTRLFTTHPGLPPGLVMPAISASSTQANAWLGSDFAVTLASRDDFLLNTGPSAYRSSMKIALRDLLENGASGLHASGLAALDASTLVEQNVPSAASYVPANGAVYPSGSYGNALKLIAQLVKLEIGLRGASLDLGGWDTHNGQGTAVAGNYFWNKMVELSQGLQALYLDLDGAPSNFTGRLTVVVMSEFGRRLKENADTGTDHGHGSLMMVVGGAVKGGLYGAWPGLASGQLFDNADLAVANDYRRVLSEIAEHRFGNPHWQQIFPGYGGYAPLGLFQNSVFVDGFESGGTGGWSSTS